jgi:acid stress-induced BolA-like protein IbaG/YrbA
MADAKSIEATLRGALGCTHVEVQGADGVHFEAVVVSPAFAGMSRVRRHQMVYAALGDRMREEIHALSMQALAPEEWTGR